MQSGTAQITLRQSILGGYYYFRNPGFPLLFFWDTTSPDKPKPTWGLYWTWGEKASGDADKPAKSFPGLLPRL